MATGKSFIDFIVEQMSPAGAISCRKMFGEYAIYCDRKVVALACDNQLFVKPTVAGKAFIGNPSEAPPYPGAKQYFLIEDKLEDSDWISSLIKITCDELPVPKPKRKRTRR